MKLFTKKQQKLLLRKWNFPQIPDKVKHYYTTLLKVVNGEVTSKVVFLEEEYLLFKKRCWYFTHQVIKIINKIKISGTYLAFKIYINLPGTDFYEWSEEGTTAQFCMWLSSRPSSFCYRVTERPAFPYPPAMPPLSHIRCSPSSGLLKALFFCTDSN